MTTYNFPVLPSGGIDPGATTYEQLTLLANGELFLGTGSTDIYLGTTSDRPVTASIFNGQAVLTEDLLAFQASPNANLSLPSSEGFAVNLAFNAADITNLLSADGLTGVLADIGALNPGMSGSPILPMMSAAELAQYAAQIGPGGEAVGMMTLTQNGNLFVGTGNNIEFLGTAAPPAGTGILFPGQPVFQDDLATFANAVLRGGYDVAVQALQTSGGNNAIIADMLGALNIDGLGTVPSALAFEQSLLDPAPLVPPDPPPAPVPAPAFTSSDLAPSDVVADLTAFGIDATTAAALATKLAAAPADHLIATELVTGGSGVITDQPFTDPSGLMDNIRLLLINATVEPGSPDQVDTDGFAALHNIAIGGGASSAQDLILTGSRSENVFTGDLGGAQSFGFTVDVTGLTGRAVIHEGDSAGDQVLAGAGGVNATLGTGTGDSATAGSGLDQVFKFLGMAAQFHDGNAGNGLDVIALVGGGAFAMADANSTEALHVGGGGNAVAFGFAAHASVTVGGLGLTDTVSFADPTHETVTKLSATAEKISFADGQVDVLHFASAADLGHVAVTGSADPTWHYV